MGENALKPKYVWIVHNNCRKGCTHCFCNPSAIDDINATKTLLEDLKRQGAETYIYATDQMDQSLAGLYSQVNKNCLMTGSEVNQNLIDSRSDIKDIVISLHGHTAQIHEIISPKGDFEAALANLQKVKANKKHNITIYCVIHAKNYMFLEEICEFFKAQGASAVEFLKLSRSGRAMNLSDDYFLTSEQIIVFLKKIYKIKYRYKEIKLKLINNWGPQHSKLKILFLRLFGRFSPKTVCSCGSEHVAIKSGTRDIYPCRYTITIPELKMGRFDAEKGLIFTHNWRDNLREKIEEPCRSCKIFINCQGGCRAEAVGEKKRLTGVIDIYAGYKNCPVSLGITPLFDRDDFRAIKKVFNLILKAILKN